MANTDFSKVLEQIKARETAAAKARKTADAAAAKTAASDRAKADLYVKVSTAKALADRMQSQVDAQYKAVLTALAQYQGGAIKADVVKSAIEKYQSLVAAQESHSQEAVRLSSGQTTTATTSKATTSKATTSKATTSKAAAATAAPVKTVAATTKAATTTATASRATTSAGTVSTGVKTPTPTPAPTDVTGLTDKQKKLLGTYGSTYLLAYFEQKYPAIYKHLIQAAKNGEDDANVEAWLKDTAWFKDVNQRTIAPIGAAAMANGLTLADATLIKYRDQVLAGVITTDELKYEFGQQAIKQYQLNVSKPDIARAIENGASFAEAAGDYLGSYAEYMGLSASQVTVGDKNFLNLFSSSVSLEDFKTKVIHTDAYIGQKDSQAAITANMATLQQKYSRYGISTTPEQLRQTATQLFLNDTTTEAVDLKLRNDAAGIFTPFRDRILAGEDVYSIATPYVSSMARILELPADSIGLDNQTLRNALMGTSVTKGDSTTHTAIPLWQFEQTLYKDPSWQYTNNAHEKMDAMSLDVLSRFGVIG